MSSPSCCPERSPGTATASTASDTSSAARDPRRRATTSSSRAASPRRSPPSAPRYLHAGSRVARDRARRFRFDPDTGELRESAHGQLVADWVELFAPVVFAPHRLTAWPADGSLLLDHTPFRIRAEHADGRGIPGGTVAFDVFCAVGYRAGKPRLWHAEAFSTAHPANWSAFLASLDGEPPRVVCDAHRAMTQAIEERWPNAEPHQCEWHLQHALKRLLRKELHKRSSEGLTELLERAEGALAGPNFWSQFTGAAKEAENESLRPLDRRQRTNDRGTVRSPASTLKAPGGHAALDRGARAAHPSDLSGALPASLCAEEPQPTQIAS
jgi:hypothetical protein